MPQKFLSVSVYLAPIDNRRRFCSNPTTTRNVKTGILMLNMGGPKNLDDVEPFLRSLFLDNDIIRLPLQNWLGPFIAKRRAPKVAKKYAEIGGSSPLHYWTNRQGQLLVEHLDKVSPSTSPHKYYIGFRYTEPSLDSAFAQIDRDKPSRVIAFSQYAQYCCNTTGSSINEIVKYYLRKNMKKPELYRLSFIDRWPINTGLINAFADLIEKEIEKFDKISSSNNNNTNNNNILILFTAHSLPLSSVDMGDTYTMEVGATVIQVMNKLHFRYPYRLVWQSKVGPQRWQSPATPDAIKGFVRNGYKNILLVPISFVNEHIETLHELDIEYCDELISTLRHSIETVRRCPAPNDHPEFIYGIASLVEQHLKSNQDVPEQLLAQCPLCEKPVCKQTRRWLAQLKQLQN